MTHRKGPRRLVAALAACALLPLSSGQAFTGLERFEADNLMSDFVMYHWPSMDQAAIDQFLQTVGHACIGGSDGSPCLKNARFASQSRPATSLCPRPYHGSPDEPAAAVIAKSAQACGVNPQLLLVILQKEQGLVLSTNPTARAYHSATGYYCPTNRPCDPQYAGFVNQVYKAAESMQRYRHYPASYRYRPGMTVAVPYHPNASCGAASLHLKNQATANLYNYTPYQPNQAALQAGAGTGDACSSYGNRNLVRHFTRWFGLTTANPNDYPKPLGPFWDSGMRQTPLAPAIEWMRAKGYTRGWADGTFRPFTQVSREAVAAFLYRMSGAATNFKTTPFRDVTSASFLNEIEWMRTKGITTGFGDGTYGPLLPVHRDQVAAFLYRLAGSPAFTPPATSPFVDMTPQSPFYREVCWLAAKGITTGWADGTFRPHQPVLRDQLAAFLSRFKS